MSTSNLPFVSVITPSYNQGKFIEETIESVLNQDYPNIEHIVIDGGSTDGTIDILKDICKKKSELGENRFRFISEPDGGQSEAINKGVRMAKGEIISWLCSDDTYLPGAIRKAVEALKLHPEWAMVYGRAYHTDTENKVIGTYPFEPFDQDRLFEACMICQPSSFIKKSIYEQLGGVDEHLFFCMDYDLWIRIAQKYPIGSIEDYLSNYRLHHSSKTVVYYMDVGLSEVFKTILKHYGAISNSWLSFFIKNNYQKGTDWICKKLKTYPIFGHSPFIQHTNRYSDSWVPAHFKISIKADPQNPIYMLIIRGSHVIPYILNKSSTLICSIYLNGTFLKNYMANSGSFQFAIPISSDEPLCSIEVVTTTWFIPAEWGINSDTRALSFMVEEVVPFSTKEYEMYQQLQKGPECVEQWLNENWKPCIVH